MSNIWAVVVTFNRRALLRECVLALLSFPDVKVLVVDNASTDGTDTLFSPGAEFEGPRIAYMRLKANEGGAGGFYWGSRIAIENGADWVWLMDDDVEPLPGSLDALIAETHRANLGFVCSCVRAPDQKTSLNLPYVADTLSDGRYPSWDEWLGEGLVKVRAATFVSVLISRRAIESCGLPNRKFFIWGDDTEFTQRITDAGFTGVMTGRSVVIHKRAQLEALSIVTEANLNRIRMMHNLYRNIIWLMLRDRSISSFWKAANYLRRLTVQVLTRSTDQKVLRLRAIFRGAFEAFSRDLANQSNWDARDAVEQCVGVELR